MADEGVAGIICDALRYLVPFVQFKKREKHLWRSDDSKRPCEESNNSTSTPTSPGDVFEEGLKSGHCVKILLSCIQNIEKQIEELFLLAQENEEKYIKGESHLSELTKAIDLIPCKFDDYERERREKYKIITDSKSEVSDLSTSVKNLENQLDHQEQYSRRNCILIHDITETQSENADDISFRTINEHLELALTEKELDRTHRIGNPKSGNKKTRPIIVKFARHNTRRKVFVNKKRLINTGISITKSLAKHKMEFFKKAKNEFRFNNVWTVDEQICYDEVAKKLKVYFD